MPTVLVRSFGAEGKMNAIWIPLTQNKSALVSREDYDRVMMRKWCAIFNKGGWYAKSFVRGSTKDGGKVKLDTMHRFILGISDPSIKVDHKDGDGLNNTRENLRIASIPQNRMNCRVKGKSKSGLKGVYFDRGKFLAYITHCGIRINLGRYSSAELAARVYDTHARKLFGEFAKPNFSEQEISQ